MTETIDLAYENEILRAEVGMLHSMIHGMCAQMQQHGHVYVDGTGAIGIKTGLYYSSALRGVTLEEDFRQDILWAVPADTNPLIHEEI